MGSAIAHRTGGIVAANAGDIVAEFIVTSGVMASEAGTMSVTEVIVMMVVMMVMIGVVPIGIIPTPMEAVPIIRAVPVVVVIPRIIITVVVRMIIIGVGVWVEAPIPTVANIDISIAAGIIVSCIVVVVVIHAGAGSCAETLDTGRKVLVVVGLGSGVNHAVGVGHRFSSLIHGLDVGLVVVTVGIVGLIVVSGVATDT